MNDDAWGDATRLMIAQRVDAIIKALPQATPEAIEAVADFAEREASGDPDVARGAMGLVFADALRARARTRRSQARR